VFSARFRLNVEGFKFPSVADKEFAKNVRFLPLYFSKNKKQKNLMGRY